VPDHESSAYDEMGSRCQQDSHDTNSLTSTFRCHEDVWSRILERLLGSVKHAVGITKHAVCSEPTTNSEGPHSRMNTIRIVLKEDKESRNECDESVIAPPDPSLTSDPEVG
jgi:hypothetical protein